MDCSRYRICNFLFTISHGSTSIYISRNGAETGCCPSGLVNNGYKARAQVPCGKYRIDFVIRDIAIECDGKKYHSSPERKARDRRKSFYLRKNGYRKVMRFTGSEIFTKMPDVLRRIEKEL